MLISVLNCLECCIKRLEQDWIQWIDAIHLFRGAGGRVPPAFIIIIIIIIIIIFIIIILLLSGGMQLIQGNKSFIIRLNIVLKFQVIYCAFHKHVISKVQKPPSQLRFSRPSIIITITRNEPGNTETHKTDRNPPITNHKP